MSNEILNKTLFAHNDCYGCGHDNINGLKIEIIKSPNNPQVLLAEYNAKEYMTGLPGLIHSGSIFSALDCLAAWTPIVLFPEIKAIWMTRSSNISYLAPAYIDQPLLLSAHILHFDPNQGGPATVATDAKNSSGELVTQAEFKIDPLSKQKYMEITGIDPLPTNWEDFISR